MPEQLTIMRLWQVMRPITVSKPWTVPPATGPSPECAPEEVQDQLLTVLNRVEDTRACVKIVLNHC